MNTKISEKKLNRAHKMLNKRIIKIENSKINSSELSEEIVILKMIQNKITAELYKRWAV